ncbi:MAG: hypothetical protein AAFN79_12500, partial [Pseudomonadota bacterium]
PSESALKRLRNQTFSTKSAQNDTWCECVVTRDFLLPFPAKMRFRVTTDYRNEGTQIDHTPDFVQK